MTAFIVDTKAATVIGFVQNVAVGKEKAGENLVVAFASDLEDLSLQQLTDIFNNISGADPVGKFKIAKDKAAEKVYSTLFAMDKTKLIDLGQAETQKVEDQSKVVGQKQADTKKKEAAEPAEPKVRKVRDSKLQRMLAMFMEKDDKGEYKVWSIKDLMERCGTSDRVTKAYISILRSEKDRFFVPITKHAAPEGGVVTFQASGPAAKVKPEAEKEAPEAQPEQAQA